MVNFRFNRLLSVKINYYYFFLKKTKKLISNIHGKITTLQKETDELKNSTKNSTSFELD